MKTIGIFGGSFNPIHNGHIQLAKHILKFSSLDEIWFMVSPQNPLKPRSSLLDDHLRLEMAQVALQDEPRFIAKDDEFRLSKPSYTWHTLQCLSNEYPDTSFTLIIGADNWHVFNQWAHYQEILQKYEIIIYPRQHTVIDTASLPSNVHLVDTPLYNISSTEVRQRIQQGKSVDLLIPSAIVPLATRYYPHP